MDGNKPSLSIKNPSKKFFHYLTPVFLILVLATSLYGASIQCIWTGIKKIVAIGDLHGDYDSFIVILKGTKIIDDDLHWIAGKTHLVQMGDVMDRGNYAKKILDLLIALSDEAEKAGGKVHMLIGNHEEMNITGIALTQPSYVSPEQFQSFLPEKFRLKKEKELIEKAESHQQGQNSSNSGNTMDLDLSKYWEELIQEDRQAQLEYIKNFHNYYGKWIIKQNAVIKINDIIFSHGGVCEKWSTSKLESLNELLRRELDMMRISTVFSRPIPPGYALQVIYKTDSPLWYRDFATKDEEMMEEEVERILSNLQAKHMVIAHTTRPGSLISLEYMKRFNGKIWIIDTGISHYYGGLRSALIIEDGKFSAWEAHDVP